METITTTMSKSYQITLPSAIRKAIGIEPGVPVEFQLRGEEVILRRALTHEEQVKKVFAELERLAKEHRRRMTPEQKRIAKMTAGWTVNQFHEYFDELPETKAYLKEKYGV